MTAKPRVLIDCDGVWLDFVGHALRWAKIPLYPEDITEYAMEGFLAPSEVRALETAMTSENFVASMPGYDCEVGLLSVCGEMGNCRFVSKPHETSKYWAGERWARLIEAARDYFGPESATDRICLISGRGRADLMAEVLIDDSPENILTFVRKNPRRVGILWARPWNRRINHPRVVRTSSYLVVGMVLKDFNEIVRSAFSDRITLGKGPA